MCMTNLLHSQSVSLIDSPNELQALSDDQLIAQLKRLKSRIEGLDAAEADQLFVTMQEYERRLDMEDVAAGLTADLSTFMRQAWNVIEPETPLVWDWSYEYLCSWLEMVASVEFKRRYPEKLGIIINQPPRSGKSLFTSVNF